MSKHGIKWDTQWPEAFSLAFIALGFIIAALLQSAFLSYFSVFLAGLVAGRVYYLKRYSQPILPFVLMILGFLVGYFTGSIWTSRLLVLVYFILGIVVSYYLHSTKILATFKSEDFVK